MKSKLRPFVLAVLTAVGSAVVPCATVVHAAVPESADPIKIALFDWTSVNLNGKILGTILERLGYTVEYPTADYLSSVTTGLTTGDLTITMEMWDTSAGEAMKASDATGLTERLGPLGPKAKEEWWYPAYMKEKCPGLPNWEALKDPKCAEAFATPETTPKGRYLGAPVTWEGYDDERVKALGLPFEVVHSGTDAAMFAELDSAYQRKAPIILWVYSPHWAPAKYEGEWVEFPPYTPECYAQKLYTCGKPTGDIWKYAWVEMKTRWPVAYKIAKAYTIPGPELNVLVGKVDLEGRTMEEVATEWVDANEATWRKWAE